MKQFSLLFFSLFISTFSFCQVRTIGTASDSVAFTSIVIGNDSSIYFIGTKGAQHIFVLKTDQHLDTIWTKTVSTFQASYYPSAIFLNSTNELLINVPPNLLFKLNENGSLIFSKEISIPGISNLKIQSSLEKNDSILLTVNYNDGAKPHNGIAVADSSYTISEIHDLKSSFAGKISKYNGGYFISDQNSILDSNYNILAGFPFYGNGPYFSYSSGDAVVLNDSTIVGSVVVFNPAGPEADQIVKILKQELLWEVKDDLSVSHPAFSITPVRMYSNGNIACLMKSENDFYISIIDSTGYPVNSNNLNIYPDNFDYKIAANNLNDEIIFACGNIIGLADSTGATCSSVQDQMVQCSSYLGGQSGPVETDSTYNISWDILPLIPDTSQSMLTIDITCNILSINNQDIENEIIIYPNPWTDHFQIIGLSDYQNQIIITDITGKIVFEIKCKNDKPIKIPNNFSPGFYFVKVNGVTKQFRTIKF